MELVLGCDLCFYVIVNNVAKVKLYITTQKQSITVVLHYDRSEQASTSRG